MRLQLGEETKIDEIFTSSIGKFPGEKLGFWGGDWRGRETNWDEAEEEFVDRMFFLERNEAVAEE